MSYHGLIMFGKFDVNEIKCNDIRWEKECHSNTIVIHECIKAGVHTIAALSPLQ